MKKWKNLGNLGFGLLIFSGLLLAGDFQIIPENSNTSEALLIYMLASGLFIMVMCTIVLIFKKKPPSN